MVRIALNPPDNARRPPNAGDGTEFGDNFKTVVDNINLMTTELYAGVQLADASTAIKPSGNIKATVGPIGSSATNVAQTLATYSLPANSLNTDGNELSITAWGVFGATGTPGVSLNVGGATVSLATGSHTSLVWELTALVLRAGANAQNLHMQSVMSTTQTPKNATDTSVDTSAITISVTANDTAAVQSSIILYGFTVEYFK